MVRVELGACWIWTGSKVVGYGGVTHGGLERYAHRCAWILTNGPIPDEMPWVLHRCDNPPCVRPDHMFLGTALDNARDRDAKGRHPPPPHPLETRNRKLSDEGFAEIQALKGVVRAADLAPRFGIAPGSVRAIWSNPHYRKP